MNNKQKKALYESIMNNVARQVKKALNEGFEDLYVDNAAKRAAKYRVYTHSEDDGDLVIYEGDDKWEANEQYMQEIAELFQMGADDTIAVYAERDGRVVGQCEGSEWLEYVDVWAAKHRCKDGEDAEDLALADDKSLRAYVESQYLIL